ncbi:MAG: PAS domain S-box protein [Melioribacteraceae bacterium]|nr:PAS domain S-box protein [Melioribacteraceae bacterium]
MINSKNPALRVSAIYFLVGSLWIIISDQAVNYIYQVESNVLNLNIIKGLGFVLATSLVLYVLLKRYLTKVESEIVNRKAVENELSRSEDLFYNLTNTSPVGIALLDPQGNVKFLNKRSEELFNITSADTKLKISEQSRFEIQNMDGTKMPFEDLPFKKVLETKKSVFDVRCSIKISDDSRKYISVNASPLIDKKDDSLLGVIVVIRDITKSVEIEEELKLSERKYRLLFENNPQPMWVFENNTLRFMDVNNAAVEKYGYSKEEFLRMTIRDIRPDEEVEILEDFIAANPEVERPSTESMIWKHKLKDGKIIFVKILSHGIELEGKDARLILVNDVTEVFQKEQELRESEKRFRRIFEQIVDVYFETSLTGEIKEVSPSIKNFSKGIYSREDMLGQSLLNFYYDSSERDKFIQKLMQDGSVDDYEVRLKNKDNSIIYCSVSAKLIDENGDKKIVGGMRDISFRKMYEKELLAAKEAAEKADQLKSEFLAQMSHEVRTPLNIIVNSNQFIFDELSDDQKNSMEDIFHILKSSQQRITRTIDSVLNMSDLQLGTYRPNFQKVDLVKEILVHLESEFSISAKAKKIDLILNAEKNNAIVNADRYAVYQTLSHLIDNAIKFTDEGKVEIKLINKNEKTVVEVIDTGIGISKNFVSKLFEPFSQEQHGYTRKYEGTGLGLALVKKFCEINNAEIVVKSEIDKGTTFSVIFKKDSNQ